MSIIREEFEKAMRAKLPLTAKYRLKREGQFYSSPEFQMGWVAWQAALEFVRNNLPDCPEEDTPFADGFEDMKFQVQELIK